MKAFPLYVTLLTAIASMTYALTAPTCSSNAVINDDYCDCLDGSDERMTAACSGITSGGLNTFTCSGSDVMNTTIPMSRVGDGKTIIPL